MDSFHWKRFSPHTHLLLVVEKGSTSIAWSMSWSRLVPAIGGRAEGPEGSKVNVAASSLLWSLEAGGEDDAVGEPFLPEEDAGELWPPRSTSVGNVPRGGGEGERSDIAFGLGGGNG